MAHFDLCVIGSGTGNALVTRKFADRRVALVDDAERFGGTCLNHGCIPTKMFVVPADLARVPEQAARLNVHLGPAKVDWTALTARIFGRLDPIAASGEAWRERSQNVTLFRETGRFVAPRMLLVGSETITADQFVLAAGSRPRLPRVPGMDDPALADRLHTSDTIMRLERLPQSLVIVGGGFVALEFAHIFSAFGVEVTLVNRSDGVLRREDSEIRLRAARLLTRHVNLRLNQTLVRFEEGDRGRVAVVTRDVNGVVYSFQGDQVLLAIGRVPNSDRLDLDAAGVAVDEHGFVVVDEHQRTTADGVWALGDVASPWMLKHVANHEARIVRHNLLHPDDLHASDHRFVPHAVFSDPPIAAVGLTEEQARDAGHDVVTAVREFSSVAYGWALEDEDHCVKLVADRGSRQLLGAHIIGPDAPNLLQPLVQAMSFGLDAVSAARGQYWIHPALSEVVENALLELDFGIRP